MDIHAYGFTVASAVIGMAIVFSFLGVMCALMALLGRMFSERPAGVADAADSANEVQSDDWLVSAIAVSFEAQAGTAECWAAATSDSPDSWLFSAPMRRRA